MLRTLSLLLVLSLLGVPCVGHTKTRTRTRTGTAAIADVCSANPQDNIFAREMRAQQCVARAPTYFQEVQRQEASKCYDWKATYANLTRANTELPILKTLQFIFRTHLALGYSDTLTCALLHWWGKILPCHEMLQSKPVMPLSVPAWLVYFAVNCGTTLALWFPQSFANVCPVVAPLMERYVRRGIVDYTHSTVFALADFFDFRWSVEALLQASDELDLYFGRTRNRTAMTIEDSNLSQNLLDAAVTKGVKYVFVGMNPSFVPISTANTTYYGVDMEANNYATQRTGTVRVFFHPLAYGNLACAGNTAFMDADRPCEQQATRENRFLRVLGLQVMQQGPDHVGMISITTNENSGSPLQAAALHFGGIQNLISYIMEELTERGWVNDGTIVQYGTVDDFVNGSLPLAYASTIPRNTIQAQQWLPAQVSDPWLTQAYSAAASLFHRIVPDRHGRLGDVSVAQQLAVLTMVEHNYAIPKYARVSDNIRTRAVWEKRRWITVLKNSSYWPFVASKLQALMPPKIQGAATTQICPFLNVSWKADEFGPFIMNVSANGRVWKQTQLGPNVAPLFHFTYNFTDDSGEDIRKAVAELGFIGFDNVTNNSCRFVLFTTFRADDKTTNVTVTVTYNTTAPNTLRFQIMVTAAPQSIINAGDTLVANFAPADSAPWKINRYGEYVPVTLAGACASRYYSMPYSGSAPPTATKGAFVLRSYHTPVAFVADNRSLIPINGTWRVATTTLSWKPSIFTAPPVFDAGLGLVLWDTQQCCWAKDAPFPTPPPYRNDTALQWTVDLVGPQLWAPPAKPRKRRVPVPVQDREGGGAIQKKLTPLPLPGSVSGLQDCDHGLCYTYIDAFASSITLNITSNLWLYPYGNTVMIPLYHPPSNTLRYLSTPHGEGFVAVVTLTDPTFSASPVTAELQPLPQLAPYTMENSPTPIACLTRSGDGFLMFWSLVNELAPVPLRILRYTFATKQLEYSDPLAAVLGPRSQFPPSVCVVLHPEYDDVVVAMVLGPTELVGQRLFVLRVPDGTLLSQHTFTAPPDYPSIHSVDSSFLTLLRGQYYLMAPSAGLVSFTLPDSTNASITPKVFPDVWDMFMIPFVHQDTAHGLTFINTWVDEQRGVVLCLADPVLFPPLHPRPVTEWRVYMYNVSTPNVTRWINSWHVPPVQYTSDWPQGNAVFYSPFP
eukprot:TRINITY_DN30_c0_g1_i3.p1 TRINITY_DN30_c0_g1~~TRINITY_DN30_c0_g1_i3.p1  ORF type:complete len:1179 (+),score=142.51 TRINITY_DN30_c0_g1_i3:225-3761(+)